MDTSQSLHELVGDAGDPKTKTTPMVRRCLTLHRTPLDQFSADDCRLMLGQKFSPQILVPIALGFLAQNPMEGGDFAPGNLLRNVLNLPADFWKAHPDLWWQLRETVLEVEMLRDEIIAMTPAIEAFQAMKVDS